MSNLLEGKTAIVTGGASGIGKGIAECFAREGAKVVIADRDLAMACRTAEYIGCGVVPYSVDVTSTEEIELFVGDILTGFGKVDILVNNAGMAGPIGDPLTSLTDEDWLKVYDTNTVSMFRTVKALWPHFTERESGSIINIASIVAHWRGELKMKPPYNASKSAVIALTRTLAIQLAPYNVRVNSISPGLLFTGFWQKLGGQLREKRAGEYPEDADLHDDVFMKRVRELVPLGREQTPEDVGNAAVFLASDLAKNITGIDLPVDGGVLAR